MGSTKLQLRLPPSLAAEICIARSSLEGWSRLIFPSQPRSVAFVVENNKQTNWRGFRGW